MYFKESKKQLIQKTYILLHQICGLKISKTTAIFFPPLKQPGQSRLESFLFLAQCAAASLILPNSLLTSLRFAYFVHLDRWSCSRQGRSEQRPQVSSPRCKVASQQESPRSTQIGHGESKDYSSLEPESIDPVVSARKRYM